MRQSKGLTVEDRLMRYCCRQPCGREEIIEILRQGIDWECFLEKLRCQNLAPLIYKVFLTLGESQNILPERVRRVLKGSYYCALSANILCLKQLEHIIGSFQKQAIPAIIFKGLMLAELIYQDMGVRACADLDILLKKEDVFKAGEILKGLGYYPAREINNAADINFSGYRNSIFYLPEDKSKVCVHIYWHTINLMPYQGACSMDINNIWRQAVPIKLGNATLHTFSARHQLIYLSMHAFSHCFYPLILLCDINKFLRLYKEKIDWGGLADEALSSGFSKQVYYTLWLAAQILGFAVPQEALKRLKPKKMSLFEKKFISSLIEGRPNFYAGGLVYFGMNEGLRGRISFLLRSLFLPRNELAAVRQKKPIDISILDYINRAHSGINSAGRALLSWLN